MSKKKKRTTTVPATPRGKLRKLPAAIVVLALVGVCFAGVFAPWRTWVGGKATTSPMQSPSPYTLGREYIYGGNRLVAFDEPNGPPAAPNNLRSSFCRGGLFTWNDNSFNETGFKVEVSTDGTNFQLHTTTGANQSYFRGVPSGTQWVRVKAFNSSADSPPSNLAAPAYKNCRGCYCAFESGVSPDTIWVEDELPQGAVPAGDEPWTWLGANPLPYSESLHSQSNIQAGTHQHYFTNATQTLTVNAGEYLIAYVYLDPANLPSEIMLQWNDSTGWEHRAYWGANSIGWGIDGTNSRRFIGPLPAAGRWVRLEVPAESVGLNGKVLSGLALTTYNGRANWDYIGKSTQSPWNSNAPAPYDLMATAIDATHITLSWSPAQGAHHYRIERSQNFSAGFSLVADNITETTVVDTVSSGLAYLYRVQAVSDTGALSAFSNRDLAVAIVFTDNPVTEGQTLIRAPHCSELRQGVNAVRTLVGLSGSTWTDPSLSGVTIKAVHLQEVRASMDQALALLGIGQSVYTDPNLTGVPIKKVHLEEVRQLLR